MKLYYTGAANAGDSQTRPSMSLGNYISSVEVPNDMLGATLGEISRLLVQENKKQVFCLALTNTTGSTATDVTIYYDYPVNEDDEPINKYKLELAFVTPTEDSDGNPYFEKISSNQASPIAATFDEYDGEANEVNVGNILSGKSLGIWFKATLVPENVAEKTCTVLHEEFEAGTEVEKQQEISFSISYT